METAPLLCSYLVTKRSVLTGQEHTVLLWMRPEQFTALQPFLNGSSSVRVEGPIEEILPDHPPEVHLFLRNGTIAKERR